MRQQPPAPITAQLGQEIDDHFDTELVCWFERKHLMVKPDLVRRVIDAVARRNSFHPVRDYLRSLRWEGVPRVGSWLTDYCGVEKTEYSRAVGKKFLISACARIMEPGCKVDHLLVLEGPQGIGKSRAARILAGEWFTDQISEFGSKDGSMQLRGVWLVELGELDALNRPEMSRVKLFISQQQERFRLPYGRRLVNLPRQLVFIGTTNRDEWLRDETGGRRFWAVRCGRIDLDNLERDRDQLWAEALSCYQAEEKWWLQDEAVIQDAIEEQRERYELDPWEPVIEQWAEHRDRVSIDEILTYCLDKSKAQWQQADKNRIARCLKSLGWRRRHRRVRKSEQRDSEERYEWFYQRIERNL